MNVVTSQSLSAQAELQGRVLTDTSRRAVRDAEVSLPKLALTTRTDSTGRYRLERVPAGEHVVVTRAPGFKPDSITLVFEADETIVQDVVLGRAVAALEEVKVVTTSAPVVRGQLAGYDERKERGIGHFLDGEVFESAKEQRLGDLLSGRVPGITITRGKGARAWATSGRATSNTTCALCRISKSDILDNTDMAAGAPLACYMDVYLDGTMVYSSASRGKMPLFNMNSVDPHNVRAVEVYASTSQIPPQYVRMGAGCGVMLIWTRSAR